MKKFIYAYLLASLTALHAQTLPKSADECEVEIGSVVGKDRERRMIRCLLGDAADVNNEIVLGQGVDKPAKHYLESLSFEVNSAGGLEPTMKFLNPNKDSAIKYIRIGFTVYNAVGDRVRSTIGRGEWDRLLVTGPIDPDSGGKESNWGPVGYNHSASCLKILSLEIEFMNGRKRAYSGKGLSSALHPNFDNECKVEKR